MPVLATWSPVDAALDVLFPLGLAVAAGTCLVIDLDPGAGAMGSGPTLADLVRRGPSRRDLEPMRPGPALLANGGVAADEATEVVAALAERWPAVVVRCPARAARPSAAVAVAPLLPEPHLRPLAPPAVYQRSGFSPATAPAGIVLPRPRRRTVERLFAGRRPPARDPWVRAVARVWTAHA